MNRFIYDYAAQYRNTEAKYRTQLKEMVQEAAKRQQILLLT